MTTLASATSLPQRHTRCSARAFWYESQTVGYATCLKLAENRFVEEYPGLWTLTLLS